jgi:hypothetical protein
MSDLIKLEDINAAVLFNSDEEVNQIIMRIEDAASSVVGDVGTVKGRKEIASVAAKVARSKTYIDGLGKGLVADIKAKVKEVDSRRKAIRDSLDDIKEKVRSPLTEYENAERDRIARHADNLAILRTVLEYIPYQNTVDNLNSVVDKAKPLQDVDFEEYQEEAHKLFNQIAVESDRRRESIEETERLAAENARLKREAEAREREERERRIAEEARREAEERTRIAEAAKLEAERQALEVERRRLQEAADASARQAEEARQAEIRAEQAREQERVRQEEEKAEQERIKREREEDQKHRAAVHERIISQLSVHNGVTKVAATCVVELVEAGQIEGLKIIY